MLSEIASRLDNRQWMRSAKAWRCFLHLPDHPTLPSVLTSLIDTQVVATISCGDIAITIDPAFVVDVPSKGRRFQLVLETVYEKQASIGPKLTALVAGNVTISIKPTHTQSTPKPTITAPSGDIRPHALKGLHVTFFNNLQFHRYLEQRSAIAINTTEQCKQVFKQIMGIESCKQLSQSQFDDTLHSFRDWLTKHGV